MIFALELQTGFTRAVCESANTPVIEVAIAIEDDFVDALREQKLRDGGADGGLRPELGHAASGRQKL